MTAADHALTWSPSLTNATADEVAALLDSATSADEVAPVSENVLLHLRAAPADGIGHLLARDDAGRLVGYAFAEAGSDEVVGELAVHPRARRRGVGGALVRALLDRAGGFPLPLRVWAHGEHPGALRLAERLGFRRVRTLWQLHRFLREPLPPARFPPDVRVRPFEVGRDEPEFLRVNNAAFSWHPEQGGWGIEQVKLREAEPWFDPAGFLLAVSAGAPDRVLGFHWTKVHPDGGIGGAAGGGVPHLPTQGAEVPDSPNAPIGEVYVLGVDPGAQGRKLGTALTLAGLHHLRERGLTEVMLYVEADNAPAVAVYQRLGFQRWHTDAAFVRDVT